MTEGASKSDDAIAFQHVVNLLEEDIDNDNDANHNKIFQQLSGIKKTKTKTKSTIITTACLQGGCLNMSTLEHFSRFAKMLLKCSNVTGRTSRGQPLNESGWEYFDTISLDFVQRKATGNATTTIAVNSTGLAVGMSITGTGVPANTTISAVPEGAIVTASAAVAAGSVVLSFHWGGANQAKMNSPSMATKIEEIIRTGLTNGVAVNTIKRDLATQLCVGVTILCECFLLFF